MKKLSYVTTLALIFALVAPLAARAESPEEKGLRIAQEADVADAGFGDMTANMLMTLRNRQGEESTREVRVQALEIEGDGDKSLNIFDKPADVQGTAFLNFTHKSGPDDQWLYLPSLKRVKRISSNNKSGPFMGSEFAYEDLSSQEVEKYTYKYLHEEACGEHTCHVMERYPTDPDSGYTRQLVWMDKDEYRVWKVEFYDRKNDLLKTLTMHDYQEYLGKHWRADRMEMENAQTGKSTTLKWSNYQFKTGLSDRDFDKNALERAR